MTVGKDILLLSMLTLAFSREGKVIPQTQQKQTKKNGEVPINLWGKKSTVFQSKNYCKN